MHAEVFGLAKQLQLGVTQSKAVCTEAADEHSDWHWATRECKKLEGALSSAEVTLVSATTHILTKKYYKLLSDYGGNEQDMHKFLDQMKSELDPAVQGINAYLVPLTKMHASKFMPVARKARKAGK